MNYKWITIGKYEVMIPRRTFVITTLESIIYCSVPEYEINRSRKSFHHHWMCPFSSIHATLFPSLLTKKGNLIFSPLFSCATPCIVPCTHVPYTFVWERFLQWQATFQAKTLIIVAGIQTPYSCVSQFSSNFRVFEETKFFLYTFGAPHWVLGCVKSSF